MNLKQNIPLNYPQIIYRFLQQRIDDGEFAQLNIDETLNQFDRLEFDGLHYEFDVRADEELVCIKELLNNQVYNITKYDYTELYKDMPELLALLNHIESQVVFTAVDWCAHFTDYAPIYNGNIVDVFKTSDDTYVVRSKHAGNVNGFKVVDGTVYRISCVNALKANIGGKLGILIDAELDDADKHPQRTAEMAQTLLYLFNSEFSLLDFTETKRHEPIPVTVKNPADAGDYDILGIVVKSDHTDNSLSFEWGNKQFNISGSGQLHVSSIEKPRLNRGAIGFTYCNVVWGRITTDEEIGLAWAVAQLINLVYGD